MNLLTDKLDNPKLCIQTFIYYVCRCQFSLIIAHDNCPITEDPISLWLEPTIGKLLKAKQK